MKINFNSSNTYKSLIIYSNQVVALFSGLINTYVITRSISPSDLGSLSFIQNLILIFFFFSTTGHSALTFKKIAVDDIDKQKFYSTNLFIDFTLGLFVLFIFVFLALGDHINIGSPSILLIIFVLFEIFTRRVFVENILNVFNAKNEVATAQLVILIQTITANILIIFVVGYFNNIEILSSVYLIKSSIGAALGLYYLKKTNLFFVIKLYPNIINLYWIFIKPLLFSIVFTSIFTYLGPILVGTYSGVDELGLFVVAKKFNVLLLAISGSVSTIVFSNLSKLFETNNKIIITQFLDKVTKYVSIIVLYMITIVVVFIEELTGYLLDPSYSSTKELIIIFMFPIYLTSLSRPITSVQWSIENTIDISKINIITRIIGIISLFIFIPKSIMNHEMFGYGALGVIISHFIVGILTIIMTIFYNWKKANIGFYYRIINHVAISLILIISFSYLKLYFKNDAVMFIILLPMLTLAYFIILLLFREISIREILKLKASLFKV